MSATAYDSFTRRQRDLTTLRLQGGLTDDQARAITKAESRMGFIKLDAADMNGRLLMLDDVPFETRVEAELRQVINQLQKTLDHLAKRRMEREL